MTTTIEDVHWQDYAEEQYFDDLYREHKETAIEEFTVERLQSYFLANRLVAEPAFRVLDQARDLETVNASAALIFASISMEVGLKSTLLKPIVHGLVHTESLSALITELAVSHTSMDRYRDLLFEILKDTGGVDLRSYKAEGASQILWDEIKEVQRTRNALMHRAELATTAQAQLALGVATEIAETVFPRVLSGLDLHLHDGFRICNDEMCKLKHLLPRKMRTDQQD